MELGQGGDPEPIPVDVDKPDPVHIHGRLEERIADREEEKDARPVRHEARARKLPDQRGRDEGEADGPELDEHRGGDEDEEVLGQAVGTHAGHEVEDDRKERGEEDVDRQIRGDLAEDPRDGLVQMVGPFSVEDDQLVGVAVDGVHDREIEVPRLELEA